MVTHDAQRSAIADRVLFLADGRIVRGALAQHGDRDSRGRGAAIRRT